MKISFVALALVALVAHNAFAAGNRRSSASPASGAHTEMTMSSESHRGWSHEGQFEFEPSFGMAFTSPGDLNDVIHDANDNVQKQGVKSFSVGDFGASVAYGAAGTYRVLPALGLGLGFSRLAGSTDGSAKVNQTNTLNAAYAFSANLLTFETRVRFAQSANGKIEGMLSPFVGVGFYNSSAEMSGSALQNGSSETRSSASGAVFGSTIGGRYWFTRELALGMQAGYRYAKSGQLKVDSVKNSSDTVGSGVESNGKKISVDSSSAVVSAGLIWAI